MRDFLRWAASVLCACVAAGSWASAATVAIAPSADAYFQAYQSNDKNFGTTPELMMDQWGGRQVMLRFPLESLPKEKRILRATLRLYITKVGFNESGELPDLKTCVGLYDLLTPWTEEGVTYNTSDGKTPWNQGPGIGGPKYQDVGPLPRADIGVHLRQRTIPLDASAVRPNAWLELDVTDFLRERQRAGDKEVNLLLRNSTLSRNLTFRSREAKEADQRPQLAVECSDTLADFAAKDVFLTDWKAGRPVTVEVQKPAGSLRWSFIRRPGASRLGNDAIKVTPTGATFTPDTPGHYQLRCELPAGNGTTGETTHVYALSVPAHPRLYINPQRLATIRQQLKAGQRLPTALKKHIDQANGNGKNGGYADFGPPGGCEDNALLFLLTQDEQYLKNSVNFAQQILKKPMREHFKDVHEATFTGAAWVHAMSVHYDWCHERLAPEHRKAVADWLKEAMTWGAARSGHPIAHNDGGARQLLLAVGALALLGDDPEAPAALRRARDNFELNLLPWLNDGGKGGRSGDGGEYEGLHGFFIVRYAWMSHSASGDDVFSDSPCFANRIKHILFGWYPRRLVEKNGNYSIRQYYSPAGDHIRLGYVGDTQPYQSAAALCDRYRNTPEAQSLKWLTGEWPTQWMQYVMKWAVLGDFEGVPAKQPQALSYLDEGFHTLYARSDWSDDATWVLFENGPFVSIHQGLIQGGFEIFKGDLLAARTGNYDFGNPGTPHALNYLNRTICGNCLLINDPDEKWKGFIGGASAGSDGGGIRTNFPLGSGADADVYQIYRPIFQRGQITRTVAHPQFTYAAADLTGNYNNPTWHGGKMNRPKVSNVTRQLLYLRDLDSVVVFDRVSSMDPAFKKTFLLHSLGELDVLNGKEAKIDEGESHYDGATRAVIRYGWPKPIPSFARCLSVTLLPENPQVAKIGGRVDLPEGKTEGLPGRRWHGPHRHHHLKDFWVNGANYPPDQPPETRWFGDPAAPGYIPGTPDESGGRGKWRIEVSPAKAAKDDVFFHVLCPRLGQEGAFPEVTSIPAGAFAGTLIKEGDRAQAVFFAHAEQPQTTFSATLPAGKACTLLVADLTPGGYEVTIGDKPSPATVGNDGLLTASLPAGGSVRVVKK